MAMSDIPIADIVIKNGQWIAENATALFISQWASAASAAQNEKEQAEYEKISESVKYLLTSNGSSIQLSSQDIEASPFQSIIEEGMPAPLSGGRNGTVTEPDGTVRPTNVPQQLWGTPLPEYAKAPNPVSEGIQQMLKTLVPDWIRQTVADCKAEIAKAVRPEILKQLQSVLSS